MHGGKRRISSRIAKPVLRGWRRSEDVDFGEGGRVSELAAAFLPTILMIFVWWYFIDKLCAALYAIADAIRELAATLRTRPEMR